jgi:hypothetical protein
MAGMLGEASPSKQLVRPIALGLPGFERERDAREVACHDSISSIAAPAMCLFANALINGLN